MTAKRIKKSKTWHVSLWMVQILLAGMFLMIGATKTFIPIEELSQKAPIAAEMPFLIRFIGISELAAGLGLLLPAALRIRPQLTVIAAAGLVLIMVLAMFIHLVRGEYPAMGTNIVLGTFAGLVAWGRLYKAPIVSRAGSHAVAKT